jgi:hypothetical protein
LQTETIGGRLKRTVKRMIRVNLQTLISFVPIIQWLPSYNWRVGLLPDLVSGVTIDHLTGGQTNSLVSNFNFYLFANKNLLDVKTSLNS